jgi:hypothetical protein
MGVAVDDSCLFEGFIEDGRACRDLMYQYNVIVAGGPVLRCFDPGAAGSIPFRDMRFLVKGEEFEREEGILDWHFFLITKEGYTVKKGACSCSSSRVSVCLWCLD